MVSGLEELHLFLIGLDQWCTVGGYAHTIKIFPMSPMPWPCCYLCDVFFIALRICKQTRAVAHVDRQAPYTSFRRMSQGQNLFIHIDPYVAKSFRLCLNFYRLDKTFTFFTCAVKTFLFIA